MDFGWKKFGKAYNRIQRIPKQKSMPPAQNIFRAYDIRGTYPDELNAENALFIGKGFASYLVNHIHIQHPKVVVGRDNRTHGEELQAAFIEGLASSGCAVTDVGLSPSPYLYFADTFGQFDAGCNITASHNPKEYNGFKLMLKDAHAVFGEEIQRIFRLINSARFVSGLGSVKKAGFTQDYQDKLTSLFKSAKKLKIVVDTANGVTGMLYPKTLETLGHEVLGLYTESNGTFPNHEPDPIVEKNLTALKKKVLETKADVGLAFDGDGDRCSIVTEIGEFVNSDHTLMLLAKDALSRNKGRTVVFTVSNSQSLFGLIERWGGTPVMCKVGHSYVEHAMEEHKAILGGEQSGHYFLPEGYFGYDDALATAGRLLKIIAESGKPVSELFSEFPKTFAEPEMRPECPDINKFAVIDKVAAYFHDKFPCNTLDGVRIDFGNGGWAGIRASNTSPKLSIVMEAQSEPELSRIRNTVLGHLKTYPEIKW
jgi:phosphomannomutase / phosphoglucomutase